MKKQIIETAYGKIMKTKFVELVQSSDDDQYLFGVLAAAKLVLDEDQFREVDDLVFSKLYPSQVEGYSGDAFQDPERV